MKSSNWRYCRRKTHYALAEAYGATVFYIRTIVQKILPWIDGLLDASEEHFAATGKLYSSHMIDLSEEPIEENIEICKGY
jgi:fructose-bisphosphate aldolase class II